MNREIKFRGRRLDSPDWVIGNLCYNMNEELCIQIMTHKVKNGVSAPYCLLFPIDPVTVGQYTGFKTPYGVEIYEHDIVGVRFGDDLVVHMDVVFENGEWSLKNGNDFLNFHDYKNDIVDVLYNIYDMMICLKLGKNDKVTSNSK